MAEPGLDTPAVTTPPAASAPSWYESIAPELQADKTVQTYKGKDFSAVVQSLVDLNRLNGSAIHLPKADAAPEVRQRFVEDILTKLGRPESPEKYDLRLPEGIPQDEQRLAWFRSVAHKAGLLPHQVQAIVDADVELQRQGVLSRKQAVEAAQRALKDKWGAQFDENYARADNFLTDHMPDPLKAKVVAAGLQTDPEFIEWAAMVSEPFVEKGLVQGTAAALEPDDARAKLDAAYADPNHPINSRDPKIAQRAAEELMKLHYAALGPAGRKVLTVT